MSDSLVSHNGSCHCGAVRFTVKSPASLKVYRCNCSICQRLGYEHLIVPKAQFELLTDPIHIHTYTFNTGVAQHTFCKHCGVKSFYTPRSNPNGISVNVRCLDSQTITDIHYSEFDGQHWEANADKLKGLD